MWSCSCLWLKHCKIPLLANLPLLSVNSPPLSPAPGLNEELVQLLLIRDELHTEQDAILVDIEDLTR